MGELDQLVQTGLAISGQPGQMGLQLVLTLVQLIPIMDLTAEMLAEITVLLMLQIPQLTTVPIATTRCSLTSRCSWLPIIRPTSIFSQSTKAATLFAQSPTLQFAHPSQSNLHSFLKNKTLHLVSQK